MDQPAQERDASGRRVTLLIIEDNRDDAELMVQCLRSAGFEVTADVVASREEFSAFIRSRRYDVILSDYRMPEVTGSEIFEAMKEKGVDLPFILVTGSLGEERAVECVKQGMADYVLKDDLARLPMAVCRAVDEWRLRDEREQAQEALRRSEAGYRSLVERSPYGIFRAGLEDGRFLEVNQAVVEMLGYECEADLLKMDPARTVYVGGNGVLDRIRDHARNRRPWSMEIAWRREDGRIITVELRGGAVLEHERGCCVELIANDITERKLAEVRIRQLNRLYAVSTHVSQAIVRIRNGIELLQGVCRIMVEEGDFRLAWVGRPDSERGQIKPVVQWGPGAGYLSSVQVSAADEAEGRGPAGSALRRGAHHICQNIETDPEFLPWREQARRYGLGGSAGSFPLTLKGRAAGVITLYSGEPQFFDEECLALLDEMAATVSFALENLELAHLRQEAVEELNQFFALSRDMLSISDMSGYVSRRNTACEKTAGFASGERWIDGVHPEDREAAMAALAQLQAGVEVDSLELRFASKEHGYKWLAASATPVPGRGAVFAVMRDITERKNLEEQLRRQNLALEEQNRRIQTANRMKSQFLANMSHELRSPLNGIVGFAEILYDGRVGVLCDPQKDLIGRMLRSSRHLLRLINDLLDVSRIEAGRMDLRPEPVVLASLVQEVTGTLAGLAAEKRIEMEIHISPEIGVVTTDPARFKQLLYNYLSNALKFSPECGHVLLGIGPAAGGEFRLEVSDTGPGIAANDIGKLFRDFQQLDSSPAKRHQGAGLGLALTKRLVEAQGGSVGVESAPGKGSTFYAVLPSEPGSDPGRSRRILVIEDDQLQLAVITHILRNSGFMVEAAATSSAALAKAGMRRFEAIALDLFLPDASGWDLLAAIRATENNRETPVIVISIVEDGERWLGRYDIQGFLTKPVRREELLGALRQVGVSADAGEMVRA